MNRGSPAETDPLTFDELRRRMGRSDRTPAWRLAGKWALDAVEAQLGHAWPAAVESRAADARRDHLAMSAFHITAYTQLLELALRLRLADDVPGFAKVRRSIITDPRSAQLVHAEIQLEVAALALRAGDQVRLEPRRCDEPPADVALATDDGELIVEARAVLTSAQWRDVSRNTDLLLERIHAVERTYDVRCEGELTEPLPPGLENELLASLEDRGRLVALGLAAPPLNSHGAAIRVVSASKQPAQGLRGPQMGGDSWARIGPRIAEKAHKAAESGATWLRLDVREGLFQFTQWARMPMARKLETLAPIARASLNPLHGIVFSSGALHAQGRFEDETVAVTGGGWACRRLITPLRVRETFVIPAAAARETAAEYWQQLYAEEPRWLGWALAQMGLPDPKTIFSY